MFRCPICGASARIRTSSPMNNTSTVRRKFYQCNSLECGVGFSTLESVERLTRRQKENPLPESFIPHDNFPLSHRGRDQLNLAI